MMTVEFIADIDEGRGIEIALVLIMIALLRTDISFPNVYPKPRSREFPAYIESVFNPEIIIQRYSTVALPSPSDFPLDFGILFAVFLSNCSVHPE